MAAIDSGLGAAQAAQVAEMNRATALMRRKNDLDERRLQVSERRQSGGTVSDFVLGTESTIQKEWSEGASALKAELGAPRAGAMLPAGIQRERASDAAQAVEAADKATKDEEADATAAASKELKSLAPAIAATAVAFRTVESAMKAMNDLQTGGAMTQAQARKRLGSAMAEAGFKKEEIESQQALMASGEIGQLEQSEFVKLFEAGARGMGGIATDVGRRNILETVGLSKQGKLPAGKAEEVLAADQFGIALQMRRFGAETDIGATGREARGFLSEQDRERVASESRTYEAGQAKKRLRTELETQARESVLGAFAQTLGFNDIAVGLSANVEKQPTSSSVWSKVSQPGGGGALSSALLQKQAEMLEEQTKIMRAESTHSRSTPATTTGRQ
jgi:hypothetical protein